MASRSISKRKPRPASKTISIKRLSLEELRIGALLYPERDYWRPLTRGDCAQVSRPCPYVSCRHHLFLEVRERSGGLRLTEPDREVWEVEKSCSLDRAAQGPAEASEVARLLNLTPERVRQIELRALEKLRAAGDRGEQALAELARHDEDH